VHSAQIWAICWGHNFFIFDQNWPTKKENEKKINLEENWNN
jgi:hypothetical protein